MKYVVNKLSVLLLEQDQKKGFNTVAYDHKTDEIIAVRPKEYSIIKYISDSEGLCADNFEDMVIKLKIDNNEAEKIVSELIKKGILEYDD